MALFGLFGKKDDAAEIKKLAAKVEQKFGPPENRFDAMVRLRDMATPEAYAALLMRFTIRVDPSITDDDEKQFVLDAMVAAGDNALAPVKAFILKSEVPTWGIRILEKLADDAEVVGTVLEALAKEGPEYTRDPDKKITLLRWLQGHTDARIGPALAPFLEDPSEDVRSAAVEVLMTLTDPAIREPLIAALLRAHEDNSERMRRLTAAALVKTGFDVKGHTPAVEKALPPGYTLDKAGVVHAR